MLRHLRELLLWAGAALGLLAVGAGLAVALGGFSFLIFRSGSMSPEIPTGGIALARTVDAADLRPGDVVSVTAASGERITHRVVTTTLRGEEATLVLKGDANATEDAEVYVVRSAERVVGSVPVGGYVVAHALTPPGLVALGSLSLMLVLLTSGREPAGARPDAAPRHRGRVPLRRRLVAGGLAVVVAGGAGAALLGTTGTFARFTDAPRAASGSLSAGTIGTPGAFGCQSGFLGLSANLTWSAPASPVDGYLVTWVRSGVTGTATVTTTSWRPTGLPAGTYSVTVRSVDGAWTSAPTAADTITANTSALGPYFTC